MYNPVLLLDLICNRSLSALDLQAVTYYNVLAGRTGSLGMIAPQSPALPFYQRHLEDVGARDLVSLGRDGLHMKVESSRFHGKMVQSEDGNWRQIEPYNMTPDGTAIIHVIGALVNRGAHVGASSGVTSYEGIDYSLTRAAGDKRVKAILLDISSPGGESAGNDEIARKIIAVKQGKPVFGVAGGLAASAGYAILAACTEAYATPSSLVGSIGCIMLHMDKTEQAKNEGVVPTIIYAGSHKADGHAYQSLTPEALRELKAGVNSYYDLFVQGVGAGRGRKLTANKARETEARTFVGAEAKTAGLIDDLATFEQVLSSADENNRRKARRSATSREGSQSMSELLSQAAGGIGAEVPSGAIFHNGQWMVPMGAAVSPPAATLPAPPSPATDPRIAQAMAHPSVANNAALAQHVMNVLRQQPSYTAEMAVGLALATQQQPTPAAAFAPPAYTPVPAPAPVAAAPGLPLVPMGYTWVVAANGQPYMVQAAGPAPAAPTAPLAARVDLTGANTLVPGLGVSPSGAVAAPAAAATPSDQPGSITAEMAPWDAHVSRANARARNFGQSYNGVHEYVPPDAK